MAVTKEEKERIIELAHQWHPHGLNRGPVFPADNLELRKQMNEIDTLLFKATGNQLCGYCGANEKYKSALRLRNAYKYVTE